MKWGAGTVLVEAEDNLYGVNHPARNMRGILDLGRRLEDAVASVRPAARAATLSGGWFTRYLLQPRNAEHARKLLR